MEVFKCRRTKHCRRWHKINAGHSSIAAQLFAEKFFIEDGELITVRLHGRYRVERRVVIHKA
jgi:hypothetical protein